MTDVVELTIHDITQIDLERQKSERDVVRFFTGLRGNGKSTLAMKIHLRNPKFKPWQHIVYSRNDLMGIMEGNTRQPVLDDEAIRTGFSRNFFDSDQKTLIQVFNMYRDNFNIYEGCIPTFLDLDTNLRGLATMWVHVPYRGIAVVNSPLNNPYLKDQWDTDNNRKKIMTYIGEHLKNSNFAIPWHKLSTFAGYIYFNPLTPVQEALYKEIKKVKRKAVYDSEMGNQDKPEVKLYDNIIGLLDKGQLDVSQLQAISLANGLKYTSVRAMINQMLVNRGDKLTLSQRLDALKPKPEPKRIRETKEAPVGIDPELYKKLLAKGGM